MKKIGLFYGSHSGTTGNVAKRIAKELGEEHVDIYNISENGDLMDKYQYLIIGTSTWNVDDLQKEWDKFMPKLEHIHFAGKTVALFGTGDQDSYPDTFLDGMGMLYETFMFRGAKFIGFWPTVGYEFTSPYALLDHDHFVGLAIDEDNQSDQTERRIKEWCKLLRQQFDLA